MARTRSRSNTRRSSKGKGPSVAFTRSADDRNVGSGRYLRLNDDEKFEGYALFNPDPAAEDNPGYVEYGEHWDNAAGRFVPCWGIKNGCIYCKAGQQPSQRAMAAFLVTSVDGDELSEPEIKLFRMNWTMIQEWGDTLDEDGETLGQKVRVKCMSRQDGDYTTKFFDKDRMTKKDLKSAVKDIPDIEEDLQRSLDRSLSALRVTNLLEEDEEDEDVEDEEDEEEEEPKTKTKRGRGRPKKEEVEEEEEDDEDEEEEGDEEDDEEEGEDEEESEDDEEEEDEESDEEEEDEEEDERAETIDGEYTVVSVSESEMTFTVKELDSDLYVGQNIVDDVDFDDFKKGDKIKVVATQDDEEDWVATEITKVKSSKKSSGGKKEKSKTGLKSRSRRR